MRTRPTLARGRWRVPYRAAGSSTCASSCTIGSSRGGCPGSLDGYRRRPRLAPGRARNPSNGPPTRNPDRSRATERTYALRLRGRAAGMRAPRRDAAARPRARVQRGRPAAARKQEYALADRLLCPSDFVAQTFLDEGFPRREACTPRLRIRRASCSSPPARPARERRGLTVLFVGVCAVRKGVHFALEAWLRSAGQHYRLLPDRRGVPPGVRGEACRRCSPTRASTSSATATTSQT